LADFFGLTAFLVAFLAFLAFAAFLLAFFATFGAIFFDASAIWDSVLLFPKLIISS